MISTKLRAVVAVIAASALLAVGAAPALASHNRSDSSSSFSVTGDNAMWQLRSAWIGGSSIFSDTLGDTLEVKAVAGYGSVVNTGTSTGVNLTLTAYSEVPNNVNYAVTTETLTGSLAALPDGIYEVYASRCCRVLPQNSPGQRVSAWARFTKTGGVYNVAPVTTNAPVLTVIDTTGTTSIDFAATDSQAVTYNLTTDVNGPIYGYTDIPCSTFTGSVLSLGSTLCTGGEIWADVIVPGYYWGARVITTDATGNSTTTSTLLHVEAPVNPLIGGIEPAGAGGVLRFSLFDSGAETVDSYSLTCTNIVDATDVVTATTTSTYQPVVSGFTVGQEYDCEVTSSNSTGTVSNGLWSTGVVGERYIELTTNIAVGQSLSGKTVTVTGVDIDSAVQWTLVQNPENNEFANGFSDGASLVNADVVVPSSACVAGSHVLTVTAQANTGSVTDGEILTDSLWYTVTGACIVSAFSFTDPALAGGGGTLAATGVSFGSAVPGGAAALLLAGFVLVMMRRRATV